MIRTRKIIGRDKIFDYVGNSEIAKLEILTSKQKTLKNKEVVSVYIYHRLSWNDVLTMIGRCKIYCEKNPDRLKNSHTDFVTGMLSAKRDGFVSECNINKLIEIELKTGFDFCISKQIRTLCQCTQK